MLAPAEFCRDCCAWLYGVGKESSHPCTYRTPFGGGREQVRGIDGELRDERRSQGEGGGRSGEG